MTKNTLSDIQLKIGDKLIPAHRCIIIARSEVLRAMFVGISSKSDSNILEINGVDSEVFIAVLQFIYSMISIFDGTVDLMGILSAANQFALPRLVARCELALTKFVEKETADRIADSSVDLPALLKVSHANNAKQLVDWCLHFISTNYSVFEKKGDIQHLDEDSATFVIDNRWPPVTYIREMEEYQNKYYGEGQGQGQGASSMKCMVM